jgi:hypothetical protein
MRKAIKHWQVWAIICVMIVLAVTVTGSVLRFPIGLGFLRVAFLVTEQFWTRVRL